MLNKSVLNKSVRNKTYTLPQGRKERLRLLSWPRILIFTLLIIAVMALLFPRTRLIDEIVHSKGQDPLSRNYLLNLLKSDPGNAQLQLKRALMQIDANQLQEAEQLILELQSQNDPAIRIQLAQALLTLREQQAFIHPAGSLAQATSDPRPASGSGRTRRTAAGYPCA